MSRLLPTSPRRSYSRLGAATAAGILVLASAAVIAGPAYAVNGFTATNGIVYTITGENTVTATGYTGSSTEITVPATTTSGNSTTFAVTAIGAKAFWGKGLTSATLTEGLETVDSEAFYDNALTRIDIPASVTAIGPDAFGASSLTLAVFAGAAPTTFTQNSKSGSLGDGTGLLVHYLAEFGTNDGFTSPTWQGYNSTVDCVMTFDLGGNGPTSTQRTQKGQPAVAPATPEAAGWSFAGWFSDQNLTVPFDFTAPINSDVTAHAKWTVPQTPAPDATTATLNVNVALGDIVAGAEVTVSAAHLQNNSDYSVIVRSTPTTIASGTANNAGTVNVTATMPTGLSAGRHTVTFSGTTVDGTPFSRAFYVTISAEGTATYLSDTEEETATATTTTTTAPATKSLAATGTDAAPLGLTAALLLLAGAAFIARRRRVTA
jgi:uncharacterized repeat protein (TIGR02543 family)/LPXTG-motif cell wall-anchored protein